MRSAKQLLPGELNVCVMKYVSNRISGKVNNYTTTCCNIQLSFIPGDIQLPSKVKEAMQMQVQSVTELDNF
jgi:hypothetical protein